jgi:predicted membrane channel-forming protein YqfA (hemolysin III family)
MTRTADVLHREEIANAITHGVGALASAAAGAVLITLAARIDVATHLGHRVRH